MAVTVVRLSKIVHEYLYKGSQRLLQAINTNQTYTNKTSKHGLLDTLRLCFSIYATAAENRFTSADGGIGGSSVVVNSVSLCIEKTCSNLASLLQGLKLALILLNWIYVVVVVASV